MNLLEALQVTFRVTPKAPVLVEAAVKLQLKPFTLAG